MTAKNTTATTIGFNDLVATDTAPPLATPAKRTVLGGEHQPNEIGPNISNNGFLSAIFGRSKKSRTQANRRTFLRGSLTAAAVGVAAGFTKLGGPAKTAAAQSSIVGQYPRRVLLFCPPLNSGDNCQPGCGSSPICTDCCDSAGYFKDDPANGYSLYPGNCGGIADGWIWRYAGTCGNCSTIEYRCTDGYVQTANGPAPFICRAVTECVPLGDGEEAVHYGDAARPTNWSPYGQLELVKDIGGGSIRISGWVSDGSGTPLSMRVLVDGQIFHWGTANLERADLASRVSGGTKIGYNVTMPLDPATYKICVDALSGTETARVGCVTYTVGSGGQASSGVVGSQSAPRPTPTLNDATDDTATSGTDTQAEAQSSNTSSEQAAFERLLSTSVGLSIPENPQPSNGRCWGGVQLITKTEDQQLFVSGWAFDFDGQAPFIQITGDGEPLATFKPDLPRPEITSAIPQAGSTPGFAYQLPLPDGVSRVCVELIAADDGEKHLLGCRDFAEEAAQSSHYRREGDPALQPPTVFGNLDSLELITNGESSNAANTGTVKVLAKGFAFQPERLNQSVEILVSGSEQSVGATADMPSVQGQKYGVEGDIGFEVEIEVKPGNMVRADALLGDERVLIGILHAPLD